MKQIYRMLLRDLGEFFFFFYERRNPTFSYVDELKDQLSDQIKVELIT